MKIKKNVIVTFLSVICFIFVMHCNALADEAVITEFRFDSSGKVMGNKLDEYGDKDGYVATYGKGSLVCYMDNINARALEWSDPEYNGGGIVPIIRASDKNRWGYVPSFVVSFSTKDYVDINFSAEMGGSSNGPSQWKLQYSTDGANYIDINSTDITIDYNSRKTMQNYYSSTSLTADVNDRNLVYVRIIASSTATVAGGDYTTNPIGGEVAVNNIVIKGTLKEEDSQTGDTSSSSSITPTTNDDNTEDTTGSGQVTTEQNTTSGASNRETEAPKQTEKPTTTSSIEGKTSAGTDVSGGITNGSSEGGNQVTEIYTRIIIETKENGETVTSVVVEESTEETTKASEEETSKSGKNKKKTGNKETSTDEKTTVNTSKEDKADKSDSKSVIMLIVLAAVLVAGIGAAFVVQKIKNKG